LTKRQLLFKERSVKSARRRGRTSDLVVNSHTL
jgi:hypothetical protein